MDPKSLPLRDIHLPEPIAWWPPALGWWLLVMLMLILIGLVFFSYYYFTRKTALKQAQKLLDNLKQDRYLDDFSKLCQISQLLRRAAISQGSRDKVAGLTGMKWLEYLDQPFPDKPFSQGIGTCLLTAPYQDPHQLDGNISELIGLCEKWLNLQSKRKK